MSEYDVEGGTTRTRSKFENNLNENKVQFARITDKNVNFVLCFKGLFYVYKKNVLSFYFEIDIEQNLHFVPNACKLYLILVLILML